MYANEDWLLASLKQMKRKRETWKYTCLSTKLYVKEICKNANDVSSLNILMQKVFFFKKKYVKMVLWCDFWLSQWEWTIVTLLNILQFMQTQQEISLKN